MEFNFLRKFLLICCFLIFLLDGLVNAKVPDLVVRQKKAVVTIYINDKDGNRIATASGFVVHQDGIIATSYHVLSKLVETGKGDLLVRMENGAFLTIESPSTFDYDEENDVALFKVSGKDLPTVKLATDYKPRQGESIVVIGSPLGLETTVSDGIISSLRGKGGLIQITAPISPGSSGSPVLNSKGEVIGVATFLVRGGQNLNFAIPVRHVAELLSEHKKSKKKFVDDLGLSNRQEAPLPAPAPSPAPAPEKSGWKLFSINADDTEFYYEEGSIYYVSNNIARVWIKSIETEELRAKTVKDLELAGRSGEYDIPDKAFSEMIRDYKLRHHSIQLEEVNCQERMTRTLSLSYYSEKGDSIYELPPELIIKLKRDKWKFIKPNTIWATLYKVVCLDDKLN